jgi:tRNA pseudouridine38-40 synthase
MQKQPNKKSVQGEIESALKKLNINSSITHAGRTDKGVHALNQVISFKIEAFWKDLEKLKNSLNKILLPNIFIKKIFFSSLHPRFDAKKRVYRYILSSHTNPFIYNYTTFYPKPINYSLLQNAIKLFEGEHDFEYFAKTGSEVKDYKRIIFKTKIFPYKNFTIIKIEGNGFLRAQIRLIVNSLLELNENKISVIDIKKQLNKEKIVTKHPAPPNGLYLERIFY